MLDTLDYKIIACLMQEGRITWSELAEILGLSPPAAADRVRRLEEQGVIQGYAALIDPEAVHCELTALVAVTLGLPGDREAFIRRVLELPEIVECHHIAGAEDYLLKIRCSGIRSLEEILSAKLKSLPGVIKTRTTVILSTLKDTPVLPLPHA